MSKLSVRARAARPEVKCFAAKYMEQIQVFLKYFSAAADHERERTCFSSRFRASHRRVKEVDEMLCELFGQLLTCLGRYGTRVNNGECRVDAA
ncbi:hypothetical protein D3C85_980820 [compost metagenome]